MESPPSAEYCPAISGEAALNSPDVGLQGVSAGGLDWKDDLAVHGKYRRKHRYNHTGRQLQQR